MKVQDPVCGMSIESERAAAHSVRGGQTVYFCSVACQKSYEQKHPPAHP
jgi:YHS domain-containing protein